MATHAATPRRNALDEAIDRAVGLASDAPVGDPRPRLRAFEGIVLVHLLATLASGAFPKTHVPGGLQAAAVAVLAACLAAWWSERFAPLGVAGALCAMLALASRTFPQTGNHNYLELWLIGLLLVLGRRNRDEGVVLLASLRWIVAVMMFHTGLQKVLYGTYFDAQFLVAQVMIKPPFAEVFGLVLPAEELARIQAIRWDVMGDGPVSTSAPLMLVASNAVWIFELAIPFGLLWRKTRAASVIALLAFTLAIQSGAREAFFGGLLVNATLLFWPRDLHSRAIGVFAAYYGLLVAVRYLAPEVILR